MTDPRTLSITVRVKFRWWTKPLLLAAGALYAVVFRWGIKVEVEK